MTPTLCPVCGADSRPTLTVKPARPAHCKDCHARNGRPPASAFRIPRRTSGDLAPDEIDRLYRRSLDDQRRARRRLTS